MLPTAHVSHRSDTRLRIRIPSQKGNTPFFDHLRDKLLRDRKLKGVEVNPVCGSVLLLDRGLDPLEVAEYAEKEALFSLEIRRNHPASLSQKMAEPIGRLSDHLNRFSGGQLDLPGLAFLMLIGIGTYQVLKGNFRSPPWYTAFWYAFGVFTKSLADRATKEHND
jgi:hypothetical protein